jgi:hypothetical protein
MTFKGSSLDSSQQIAFLFSGCKSVMTLSKMDAGIVSIDTKEEMSAFFAKPLTFLLNDGLDAIYDSENEEKAMSFVSDYLFKVKRRRALIKSLIDERTAPNSSEKEHVNSDDARSAVHAVVKIADRGAPEALKRWQKEVFLWMFHEDGSRGFLEPRTVKLPICYGRLASARGDRTSVLLHDITVKRPRDIWQVAQKEDGRTAFLAAIQAGCQELAVALVKRNELPECRASFSQGEGQSNDVTDLYSAIATTDGSETYERQVDVVGLNTPESFREGRSGALAFALRCGV